METPVVYFYTDKETKVSVKVDFPRGWITEWYPFAATAPNVKATKSREGRPVDPVERAALARRAGHAAPR